ncbi:uncharacterized protein [Diadema antillarum]|uniref:uncharacterized protein n=1 Tax=Diadema antillarum TaxID=105358 RepID=UPI003A842203
MAERLRTEELPAPWKYAVTSDGRVFFINDESRLTTWVHPVTGVPVASGYDDREDLPRGWQEDVTPDGQVYFVNHYSEMTTFSNPVTGRSEMDTDPQDTPQMLSPSNHQGPTPSSTYPHTPQSPTPVAKPSFKKRTIPKHEAPKVKRREGAVVSKDGWLYKKDSGPLGVWRKRWCVVSDFCLFYYKGDNEVNQAGTVMLPSYAIKPVEPSDKITRKFAFKCEHSNMRTYYFAAESGDLMQQWIEALNSASQVQLDRGYGDEQDEMEWGGGQVRSPRSLRRNERPVDAPGYPNSSSPPRPEGHAHRSESPPQKRGWGNYETVMFDNPNPGPGGDAEMRNGVGPDRSYLHQSSRESWEGSQPRGYHDDTSFSSSLEERRSGQNSHLSPPRSPSMHSASSHDRSYGTDKPRDIPGYNYVDIADIKERKRSQRDSSSRYTSQSSHPDDESFRSRERPPASRPEGHLDNGRLVQRNGHVEMDGQRSDGMDPNQRPYTQDAPKHPAQDQWSDPNNPMNYDPEVVWGQGPNRLPRNAHRSDSRRSDASQRSISEPSHQRGLAPMEEVPITRVSTERLQQSARPESYRGAPPTRGREPSMHDHMAPQHARMPPQHGRVPSEHGRVPSEHGRVPPEHGRVPSEHGRVPSEHGRIPSEHGRVPSEYRRGPPDQGRPAHPQYGRVPSQHGRAPQDYGRGPPPHQGRPPPEQGRVMGRGPPQRGRMPHPQERMPVQQTRAPQEHGRPPSQQGRGPPMRNRGPPPDNRGRSPGSRTPSTSSNMSRDTQRMSRSRSRDRSMIEGDTTDIAPSRRSQSGSISSSQQQLNRNDTLRRQELEKDDNVAPLQPIGARQGAPKTGRYRMWQQKTQQFVDLSTGIRLRLSIAAGDLIGKSHEELVLFLIQLRRDKANLQEWLAMIDNELSLIKDRSSSSASQARLRPRRSDSMRRSVADVEEDEPEYYQEMVQEREEVARELDISSPLINLVDNLVRMGSLYGGDNHMIAQEFYGDKAKKGLPYSPPKKLIEFSRRLEEEKLVQNLEADLKQLETTEDIELQEKIDQLRELDKKLQEISSRVNVLRNEKDKIENTLERLEQQISQEWEDQETVARVEEQQRQLERQLTRVRSQLAQGTKELEEITAENGRIEHEVALMRSGMEGMEDISREKSADSVKEKLQMEREVSHVQSVMNGLERQRTALANQMDTLRRTQAKGSPGRVVQRKSSREALLSGPYAVTDLDTLKTVDIDSLTTIPSTPDRLDSTPPGDSKMSYLDPQTDRLGAMGQVISPGVYATGSSRYGNQGQGGDPRSGVPQPRYGDSFRDQSDKLYPNEAPAGFNEHSNQSWDGREGSHGYGGGAEHYDRNVGDSSMNVDNRADESSVRQDPGMQASFDIPPFDDVMGSNDVSLDHMRVPSRHSDVHQGPGSSPMEQNLVHAEYTAPVLSPPSFSAPLQQPEGKGSGRSFMSTDLDTGEKYPETGQEMERDLEPVRTSYEETIQEPVPHPFDQEESFKSQEEEIPTSPLKSPELTSDLTPVGLFHYTSLSPKGFDDPPPKKHSPKQLLELQSSAPQPNYATQSPQSFAHPAPPKDFNTQPPPSSQMRQSYPDGKYYASPSPASSMTNVAGVPSQKEEQRPVQYDGGQWDAYNGQPQWDYGYHGNTYQPTPSESSYLSEDSKMPKERKTSLYGPTPFRKAFVDSDNSSVRSFSSVSGVQRRRKPGLDEEKKNRRKSASVSLSLSLSL